MYRIVLADDEKWALYGLSRLINWADYHCEIVGMVNDGISALELCRREKPDLLISDIRMPGIDGLELVRCIALEIPQCTVVLITGYNELQYVQRALRLGVFDFLLKQITPEDMDRMLRRYLEHVHKKARALSSSFYFSFFDESNTRSVAVCMEDLCIQAPFSSVCAYTFQFSKEMVISHALIHQADAALLMAFHTGVNRITCYCFSNTTMPDVGSVCYSLQIDIPQYTGVSKTEPLSAGFYELYIQSSLAVLTAKFYDLSELVYYQEWSRENTLLRLEPIRTCLTGNNLPDAITAITLLLRTKDPLQIDQMEMLLHKIASLFYFFGSRELTVLEGLDLYQYASNGGTCEDLVAEINVALDSSVDSVCDSNQLMERILHYIDLHYTENIRICDVASAFFLNASYMSTLIRKRTGKTYTVIVTEKRIECAKRLLNSTNQTVMEVAHMVGYQDYSHFYTLFKRACGMTPAQYRKQKET